MFGHNNNDQISQDQQSDAHVPLADDTLQDLTSTPAPNSSDQPAGAPPVQTTVQPGYTTGLTIQPPAPAPTPANSPFTDAPSFPEASDELGEEPPAPSPSTVSTPSSTAEPSEEHDALLSIKQEALTSLSPLVHNLELEAEEKFKTLMMLIQASDNQELVKEAYDAAQAIPDEKVRAQALLDVVNEINYFTHSKEDSKN